MRQSSVAEGPSRCISSQVRRARRDRRTAASGGLPSIAHSMSAMSLPALASSPSLDAHSLSQLAYVADVLGLSAMRGWSEAQDDRLPKYHPQRGDALRKGFLILQNGSDSVKVHLRSIARDGPYARLGQRTGITALFGGLRATILRIPEFDLSASLRLWLDESAAELGVVSRKGRPVGRHVSGVAYTLNEVVEVLGVSAIAVVGS